MGDFVINSTIVSEIDKVQKYYTEKKFIVWGTGEFCERIINRNKKILDSIYLFIDNDINKQNTCFYGIEVCSPDVLYSWSDDYIVICGTERFRSDVENILKSKYNVLCENILFIEEWFETMIVYGLLPPTHIRLEACTMCQLDCVDCYMRKNNSGSVGVGYLSIDNFKKIISENDYLEHIELSNSGEVFLNPDLLEILETATENNITVSMSNGVNFNNISDEVLEGLVKNNVDEITFSIDGASQDIYKLYRRKGNFNNVINNINRLNYYKTKYGSETPRLKWQYILMEHNIYEIEDAKKKARELNMDFIIKLNWKDDIHFDDEEEVKKITGLSEVTRKEYNTRHEFDYGIACVEFFVNPQFNWDGRMLGCCQIYNDDFGFNILENKLVEIVNDIRTIYIRKMLLDHFEDSETCYDFPCKQCSYYINAKKKGTRLKL